MNAHQSEDPDSIGLPTQAEIQFMEELGLQPGAVGYDSRGHLVRRLDDGSLERLPDNQPGKRG